MNSKAGMHDTALAFDETYQDRSHLWKSHPILFGETWKLKVIVSVSLNSISTL